MVLGGALVLSAGFGGFVAGVFIDQWMAEVNKEDAEPSQVTYQRMSDDKQPSVRWPANGTNLSPDRKEEINNSTVEYPIVLTLEDIQAMDLDHLKANVNSGRFKLHPLSAP